MGGLVFPGAGRKQVNIKIAPGVNGRACRECEEGSPELGRQSRRPIRREIDGHSAVIQVRRRHIRRHSVPRDEDVFPRDAARSRHDYGYATGLPEAQPRGRRGVRVAGLEEGGLCVLIPF